MNSDRIVNRITDLLKLKGISDNQSIEELTDHYLTHIEEEVMRGVNSQKAVRETYQDIANLDSSQFNTHNVNDKRGLFLFFILFVGLAFYFFQPQHDADHALLMKNPPSKISIINPPTGSPLQLDKLRVTSEFGMRNNPFAKRRQHHRGIDIKAKMGTGVLSSGNGIVKEAGYKPKAGNYITIQHDGNYITKYFHLSHISVSFNDIVTEGQLIGKVGNSGMSIMPHLHYEVLKDEVPVNPRAYIEP